jgi:hypothetical protein
MDPVPSYVRIGVDSAAHTLVHQAYLDHECIFSLSCTLATRADWPPDERAHYVGALLFGSLATLAPALQRYPTLLAYNGSSRPPLARLAAPALRPAWLLARISTPPDALQLLAPDGAVLANRPLAALALRGTALALVDSGHCVLATLARLHPDATALHDG